MKFFKNIGKKQATVDELVAAFIEVEEEEGKTREELNNVRGRVFDLHKEALVGSTNETELKTSEMQVINLQSKLETLAKLKEETKNLIAQKLRENGAKRKEDISKSLEEIKAAKKENLLNILTAQARLSILQWYQDGRPIQAPSHLEPDARDHFYFQVDVIKNELDFSPDIKSLDSQKTALLTEMNGIASQVVDPELVEELINQKRAE